MVSHHIRNEVWLRLLDIARLVRYYAALSDRYRRNYTIIRFLLYAAAASGVAAFLSRLIHKKGSFPNQVIVLY